MEADTHRTRNLAELSKWYLRQCNGDWEHSYGIKIDTLDNPGWTIVLDIKDTGLESVEFPTIDVERSDQDWFHCEINGSTFRAACGPLNLDEVIEVFLLWADKHDHT